MPDELEKKSLPPRLIVGPCGAHAGGPVALFCLAAALLGSPAGIWALVELLLGVSLVVLLGALPRILRFAVLVVRAVVLRLPKAGAKFET